MRYLYIFFILNMPNAFAAEDSISNMLESLRQKSELHHQTKKEDAGVVTIYTREELDRIQAYTLNDILKSVHFFTYQEGSVGTSNVAFANMPVTYLPAFRLYIDDHEVSSSYFGSAFYIYGDMNLGFVDHIEIYTGSNAIEFGNETSFSTIRLYSKNPKRENGSQLQLLTDNRHSSSAYIYHGGKNDDFAYNIYASGNNIKREEFSYKDTELSKDAKKSHLFLTLKNNKFSFIINRYDSLQDAFSGYGRQKTPTGKNEIDKYHQFINLSYHFTDMLNTYFSYDNSTSKMNLHEENGYNRGTSSFLYSKWTENISKAGIKGSINTNDSSQHIKYGYEYTQKKLNPQNLAYDNISNLNVKGPTELVINSLYLQDTFKVSNSANVIATIKVDNYKDNDEINGIIEPTYRVGYMHKFSDKYKAKVFFNQSNIYPSFFYTTTFSAKPQVNAKLDPVKIDNLSAEATKINNKYTIKVGMIYSNVKNNVLFDPYSGQYKNSSQNNRMSSVFFELNYHFDLFNTLYFDTYKSHNLEGFEYSSGSGATLRLLNHYNKINFFNELIFRSSYTSIDNTKIDSGYDYSLGITYQFNKKLLLSFKGENILNQAVKSSITQIGSVNNNDRNYILGMEYSF